MLALTHIHLDHAGAAGTLVERWPDLEVWVHELGAPHLVDPTRLLASATRLYGEDMDRLWGKILPVPEANLRVLTGGEALDGFEVAYTPGHASHHVSYWHLPDADGVRRATSPAYAIAPSAYILAPTPPPDIDVEAWGDSIALVRAWHPEAVALTHFGSFGDVPAHLTPSSARSRSRPSGHASSRSRSSSPPPGRTSRPTPMRGRQRCMPSGRPSIRPTPGSRATGPSARAGDDPNRRETPRRRSG